MPSSLRSRGVRASLATGSAGAVAAALLIATHGGAASAQTTTAPPSGGTLTERTGGSPVDFADPGRTYAFGPVLAATQRALYGFAPSDAATPVPDLASAAPEISADRKTVTVKLRSGVRFSPPVNREVTSADVKYAFERAFGKTVRNPYAVTYFSSIVGAPRTTSGASRDISGIQTPDAHTLVLRLSQPKGALVAAALVLPITAPVPREYAARFDARATSAYETHAVFTGPYMIRNDASGTLVGNVLNKRLELVRNPNWDRATDFRPAYLDGYVADERQTKPEAATKATLAGSHVMTGLIDPATLKRLSAQRSSRFVSFPSGYTSYMALNTTVGPLRNVDVRRAVLAALDRTRLRAVYGGPLDGQIATGFIPPGVPGYAEAGGAKQAPRDFNRTTGSLAVARRYMRKARGSGLPVSTAGRYLGRERLRYIVSTKRTPRDRQYDGYVLRTLGALGLKVALVPVKPTDTSKPCTTPARKIALCFNSWGKDFQDPQTVLEPIFSGSTITARDNQNLSQLNSPVVDRAMAAAGQLPSGAARNRAWAKVDALVIDQAAAVPLLWFNSALVTSPDVRLVKNVGAGGIDLSFSSVK